MLVGGNLRRIFCVLFLLTCFFVVGSSRSFANDKEFIYKQYSSQDKLFEVDLKKGVLADMQSNLTWMALDIYSMESKRASKDNLKGMINYINSNNYGGYSDWSLPICGEINLFRKKLADAGFDSSTSMQTMKERKSGVFLDIINSIQNTLGENFWCFEEGSSALKVSAGYNRPVMFGTELVGETVEASRINGNAANFRLVRQSKKLNFFNQ